MKTAIIGATPSGLACAISLERNGLDYDLFERLHRIGDPFHYASVWLTDHREETDWLKRVEADTGIAIHPLAAVERIIVTTPDKEEEYSGALGWIIENGQADSSLTSQLAAQIKGKVHHSTAPDLNYIKDTYDVVVACESAGVLSSKNDNWNKELILNVRGMTVLGSFDQHTVYIRCNLEYCPDGVLYMIPLSAKKLSISLCIPNATSNQLDAYWNEFLAQEEIRWKTVEAFEFLHQVGQPATEIQDQLFFAENGSGFYDPFFGWGQATAIAEGYKAGQLITQQRNIEAMQHFTPTKQNPHISTPLEIIEQALISRKGGNGVGTDESETD
ncbi:MAG: NAD(P)-binding protein [Gorillibacterium sp.]|nr:NAD(P)-binding protein [Gorillibacterium sp.]